ncbi:MAG TPA: glycosyltransferase [Chloroflexia bacterium]|nr:glycosyltransferase [Chloroflexia bacterium]
MTYTASDVSVVICAYAEERWNDLAAAIQSVSDQVERPGEIIVVIDHNPQLLRRVSAHFPDVVTLENKEERGASGARNTGVAYAKGAIMAFLDDDATAEPDWLVHLLKAHRNPRVLGVGGELEPEWAGDPPKWFPEEFKWVVGCSYRGLPERAAPIRNLIAANMSVRRDAFEALGGFRSGFGNIGKRLGCEETELCIRARQRWPKSVWLYEPQARVHHKVPAARSTWAYFRSRCYDEGLIKALVSRLVGSQDGLASERAYVVRTLPTGVAINLWGALRHRDVNRLLRAGAIVAGLAFTTLGYLKASLSSALTQRALSNERVLSKKDRRLDAV